jgi:hypothetical protein
MKEDIIMTRRIQVLAALAAFAVSGGLAHAQNSMNVGMSNSQVQSLLRSAHTVEQYQMLASYFHARQLVVEEKVEWDRRSQITAASYQKYPRPADSSRNRYEYFTYEAHQMAQQAAHFESLSTNAQR